MKTGRKRYIKGAEFSTICGVEERTLKAWRSTGMPYRPGKPCFYCPDDCRDWLVSTKRFDSASRVERYLSGETVVAENAEPKPIKAAKDVVADENISPVVKTSRSKVDQPSNRPGNYDFTIHDNKALIAEILHNAATAFREMSEVEKAAASKTIQTLSDTFRKIEVDAIEIDRKVKLLIPLIEAQKYIVDIFNRVRTDLRSLPYALSNELAAITSTDPEKIVKLIKPKIDDALRHLAEKLKNDHYEDSAVISEKSTNSEI